MFIQCFRDRKGVHVSDIPCNAPLSRKLFRLKSVFLEARYCMKRCGYREEIIKIWSYTRCDSAALNLSECESGFIPDVRKLLAAKFAVHCVRPRPVYKTRLLWAFLELASTSAAAPLFHPAPSHQLTQLWVEEKSKENHKAIWGLLWTGLMGIFGNTTTSMHSDLIHVWVVDMTNKK